MSDYVVSRLTQASEEGERKAVEQKKSQKAQRAQLQEARAGKARMVGRGRKEYFREYQRQKRAAHRAEKNWYYTAYDTRSLSPRNKSILKRIETAGWLNWAHSNKRPGTMVMGHGFFYALCPHCGDQRLHDKHGICASAHRHA